MRGRYTGRTACAWNAELSLGGHNNNGRWDMTSRDRLTLFILVVVVCMAITALVLVNR